MMQYLKRRASRLALVLFALLAFGQLALVQPPATVAAPRQRGDASLAFDYQGDDGWWLGTDYAADRTTGRVVAGDFDGDGQDDVAALYDYGGNVTRWHVWLSTGASFDYQDGNGWWSGGEYAAERTTGRVVAGDFDGDGKDDVAAMYDYPGNVTRWHVWLSTGTAFDLQGSDSWWLGTGYAAYQATGRVVAGDFDGDGRDDVAAMYDYGGASQNWHVWLSTGSNFDYQGGDGWWGYVNYGSPERTMGRVVAGDFNGDGKDDVAAMWTIFEFDPRWDVWFSDGTLFDYQGFDAMWIGSNYAAHLTTDRVVAGNFSANGIDDVAAMYDYPGTVAAWHIWLPTGQSFEYQGNNGWWRGTEYAAERTTDRVVAGDFDGDSISDVAALYDYGGNALRWHVWLSNAPNQLFLPVTRH